MTAKAPTTTSSSEEKHLVEVLFRGTVVVSKEGAEITKLIEDAVGNTTVEINFADHEFLVSVTVHGDEKTARNVADAFEYEGMGNACDGVLCRVTSVFLDGKKQTTSSSSNSEEEQHTVRVVFEETVSLDDRAKQDIVDAIMSLTGRSVLGFNFADNGNSFWVDVYGTEVTARKVVGAIKVCNDSVLCRASEVYLDNELFVRTAAASWHQGITLHPFLAVLLCAVRFLF